MWILPTILALLLTAFFGLDAIRGLNVPNQAEVSAKSTVMNYDIFRLAARTYILQNPANATYTWANLKSLNSSSFANSNMPTDWKMIVYQSGKYVLCTTHAPADMLYIFPRATGTQAPFQKNVTTLVTAENYATAQAEASRCI